MTKRKTRPVISKHYGNPSDDAEQPRNGFVGIRCRRYSYGTRYVPRVRVTKAQYELPLGQYCTCEEAALVRDVAAFYYGKKGGFNLADNDYPSVLPEIPSILSDADKMKWVSERAKEHLKITKFPEPEISPSLAEATLTASNESAGVVRPSDPITMLAMRSVQDTMTAKTATTTNPSKAQGLFESRATRAISWMVHQGCPAWYQCQQRHRRTLPK